MRAAGTSTKPMQVEAGNIQQAQRIGPTDRNWWITWPPRWIASAPSSVST
jgi:hypothetical protein